MSRVWDKSKQKGTNLVALLAIADHADDYGVAWPGLDLIAKKTRVKKRQAINLVEKLEASGELIVIHQRGRERSNRYLITVGLSPDEVQNTLDTHTELQVEDWRDSQDKGATDCTFSTRNSAIFFTFSRRKGASNCTNNNEEKVQFSEEKVQSGDVKGAIAIAPEPSINHQSEPYTTSTTPPPDFDDGSDLGFEPPDPVFAELCQYYAKHCSPSQTINPHIAYKIQAELDEKTPPEWVKFALEQAADAGVYTWNYIQTVIDSVEKTGSLDKHKEKRNGQKRTGSSKQGFNGQASGAKSNYGRPGGIPSLEAHSRYEKRANIATGETYWYDSDTGERLSEPPPGVS